MLCYLSYVLSLDAVISFLRSTFFSLRAFACVFGASSTASCMDMCVCVCVYSVCDLW